MFKNIKEFEQLASLLLTSGLQVHIFHLQTKSFAEHMALGTFYDEIVDLSDTLIEDFQGQYGVLQKYESFIIKSYVDKNTTLAYFDNLTSNVQKLRTTVSEDSNLQNQIDNIITLINSTVYKIKHLS
jgi:hypothetical protein